MDYLHLHICSQISTLNGGCHKIDTKRGAARGRHKYIFTDVEEDITPEKKKLIFDNVKEVGIAGFEELASAFK